MKTFHRVVVLCFVLGPVLHPLVAVESPKTVPVFRAGAATSNITPHLGASLNGAMRDRKAAHVHDELHARCLALDDGTTKFVLVVSDSCMIPREVFDEARQLVHEATGLPPENMLLSATHTHSAPAATPGFESVPDPAYLKFLSRRIGDGIRRALNNLEPARIGWGVGREPRHVANRRWFVNDPKILMNPFGGIDKVRTNPPFESPALIQPAGPVDPEVSVISVMATNGRPIAVYSSYSLHYVSGAPADHVSASYFGAFAESLKRRISGDIQSPPFVAMMANGTSGDVTNSHRDRPIPPRTYQQIELVGEDLARVVHAVTESIQYHDWVPIAVRQTELSFAVRKPSPEEIRRARQILAEAKKAPPIQAVLNDREPTYARETLVLASYPDRVPLILQAVRIGELGITAIPCEVFVEIGLALKAKNPFKPSFTVSLANGYNGYLPTAEHHALGGYETWRAKSSYLEVEAASTITTTLLDMLGQLAGRNLANAHLD